MGTFNTKNYRIRFHVRELKFDKTPELRQISPAQWIAETDDLEVLIDEKETEFVFTIYKARGGLHRDIFVNDVLILENVPEGTHKIGTVKKLFVRPAMKKPAPSPQRPLPTQKPILKKTLIIPKDERKRLCVFASNSCIGGVEKLTITLLKHVKEYHKTVVVTEIQGPLHEEYERYSDVCFYEVDKKNLKAFLEQNKFDVYHIFNSMHALDLLPLMHGRVIMSMFGDYTNPQMWFTMRREAFIKNIQFVDVITTDNKKNIDILGGFPLHINNGIEIPAVMPIKCLDNPIVAWVGRNSGEKRPEALLETAKSCSDVWFLVAIGNVFTNAGSIKLLNDLKALPNAVVWVNAEERVVDFILTHAAIILNTSIMEGTPVALLEAMARGCYPIAPNVGRIADLIKDLGTIEEDMTVVNFTPHIRGALKRCVSDPKLPMKVRARIVETHDVTGFVDTMKRAYRGDIKVDKTAILGLANRIEIKNCNERLGAFLLTEPWKIKSNLEFAKELYRALFFLDLDSIPYWMDVIKKGYKRRRFTKDFFELAKDINKDSVKNLERAYKMFVDRMEKEYADDTEYIPGLVDLIGLKDRLQAFVVKKRWTLDADLEFGKLLYRACFNSDLENNPYWHNIAKSGKVTRATLAKGLFEGVLAFNPEEKEFVVMTMGKVLAEVEKCA